jgi:hypothetical protein
MFLLHFSRFLSPPSMKIRVSSIIGWISALLVSALTIMSAVLGFMPPTDPAMIEMAMKMGVTDFEMELSITKLIITILFLFPRTSTVGFVLMVGYYGGALATNITHGFTLAEYAPILIVFLLLTISAYVRNPELLSRLRGKAAV